MATPAEIISQADEKQCTRADADRQCRCVSERTKTKIRITASRITTKGHSGTSLLVAEPTNRRRDGVIANGYQHRLRRRCKRHD